jgi:hypothetical protein
MDPSGRQCYRRCSGTLLLALLCAAVSALIVVCHHVQGSLAGSYLMYVGTSQFAS